MTNIIQQTPLGIIAGSGSLPVEVAHSQQNRSIFVLGFEDTTNMQAFAPYPNACVRLGAVGEAIAHLRAAGVQDIVLAGNIKRPSWSKLRPDATGAKLMKRLGMKLFSGDDALLKGLLAFLQEEGFRVLSADELLGDDNTAPEGIFGSVAPDARAQADIAHGFTVAKTLGALDIGQAVIVEDGYVLGVEAAEGTDALIARCAALKREDRGGVLVKAKKPQQEVRADLPTIGLQTVERVIAAGLAGIAVEAGGGIVLDKAAVVARADEAGIFIIGVHP